jgi:hypothetical protein
MRFMRFCSRIEPRLHSFLVLFYARLWKAIAENYFNKELFLGGIAETENALVNSVEYA